MQFRDLEKNFKKASEEGGRQFQEGIRRRREAQTYFQNNKFSSLNRDVIRGFEKVLNSNPYTVLSALNSVDEKGFGNRTIERHFNSRDIFGKMSASWLLNPRFSTAFRSRAEACNFSTCPSFIWYDVQTFLILSSLESSKFSQFPFIRARGSNFSQSLPLRST